LYFFSPPFIPPLLFPSSFLSKVKRYNEARGLFLFPPPFSRPPPSFFRVSIDEIGGAATNRCVSPSPFFFFLPPHSFSPPLKEVGRERPLGRNSPSLSPPPLVFPPFPLCAAARTKGIGSENKGRHIGGCSPSPLFFHSPPPFLRSASTKERSRFRKIEKIPPPYLPLPFPSPFSSSTPAPFLSFLLLPPHDPSPPARAFWKLDQRYRREKATEFFSFLFLFPLVPPPPFGCRTGRGERKKVFFYLLLPHGAPFLPPPPLAGDHRTARRVTDVAAMSRP